MALRRVRVALAALDEVAAQWRQDDLLDVCDGDVIQCAAVLGPRVPGPVGLWLHCGGDYPAALAARDVASLSHLVEVRRVVIDAPTHPREHADIVRAMLERDGVSMKNAAGQLRNARNRPLPPAPVEVLIFVEPYLEVGQRRLESRAQRDVGQLRFEEYV